MLGGVPRRAGPTPERFPRRPQLQRCGHMLPGRYAAWLRASGKRGRAGWVGRCPGYDVLWARVGDQFSRFLPRLPRQLLPGPTPAQPAPAAWSLFHPSHAFAGHGNPAGQSSEKGRQGRGRSSEGQQLLRTRQPWQLLHERLQNQRRCNGIRRGVSAHRSLGGCLCFACTAIGGFLASARSAGAQSRAGCLPNIPYFPIAP